MIFNIGLGIFLFLSPIFINIFNIGNLNAMQFYQFNFLGSNRNFAQLQFFQYGVVLLFTASLFSKPQRIFKDDYLSFLFFLSVISVFLHPITVKFFVNIFLGFLLYYLVVVYTKKIKFILIPILMVAVLNTVFSIMQSLGIKLLYSTPAGRIDGLMCISSHLGVYQALSIPIFYYINPYLIIIPLIGLILSKSVTSIIAVLLAIIYIKRKKVLDFLTRFGSVGFMFFLSAITVIILVLLKNFAYLRYKFMIRLDVWFETLKMISKKWYLGYGIKPFTFQHKLGLVESTYNLYLSVGYWLGVCGVLVLLFYLKDKLFNYQNATKLGKAVFLSCLILIFIGLGQSFMSFPRLAGTAIVLFAFLTIQKGEVDECQTAL